MNPRTRNRPALPAQTVQRMVGSGSTFRATDDVHGGLFIPQGAQGIVLDGQGHKWTTAPFGNGGSTPSYAGQGITAIGGNSDIAPAVTGSPTLIVDSGDDWIELDNPIAGLTIGDYLNVWPSPDGTTYYSEPTVPRTIGDIPMLVAAIDGNFITFDEPFDKRDGLNLNSLYPEMSFFVAQKMTVSWVKNLTIRNWVMEAHGGNSVILGLFYVENLLLENLDMRGAWGQLAYISRCRHVRVLDCSVRYCGGSVAGDGYAIQIDKCAYAEAGPIIGERVARPINVAGAWSNVLVRGVTGRYLRGGIMDVHGGLGHNLEWRDCYMMPTAMQDAGNYPDSHMSLGNGTHKGAGKRTLVTRCHCSEFKIVNNWGGTVLNDCALGNLALEGTGGIVPGDISVEINDLTLNSTAPSPIICTQTQGICSDVTISINGGNWTVGGQFEARGIIGHGYGATSDFNAGEHNVTLNITDFAGRQDHATKPFFSFKDTNSGTLTCNFTNVTLNCVSGTKTLVYAPEMPEGEPWVYDNVKLNNVTQDELIEDGRQISAEK